MRKRLIMLLVLTFLVFNVVNVKAENLTLNQRAVTETALQYYYRGANIQYDSSTAEAPDIGRSKNDRVRRGWKLFFPEEAADDNLQYSVCHLFPFNVYYNAFIKNNENFLFIYDKANKNYINPSKFTAYQDINILYFAIQSNNNYLCDTLNYSVLNPCNKYYDKNMFVLYIKEPTTSEKRKEGSSQPAIDEAKRNQSLQQIKNSLQPGDILSITRVDKNGKKDAGHSMLYMGKDSSGKPWFLHSTGGIYNFDKYSDRLEENGTIQKLYFNEDDSESRWNQYYFSNLVTAISIVRPLNVINSKSYSLTQNAKFYTTYPGLTINESSSKPKYSSVNIGDKITYTIELGNKSTSTSRNNIKIKSKIPTNTTYVSSSPNATKNGSDLSWTVSVGAGKTVKISYTVKVNSNENLNGKYIKKEKSTITIPSSISIYGRDMYTLVGNTLSNDSISKFENKAKSVIGSTAYKTTEYLVNYLYDINNFPSIDKLYKSLFNTKLVTSDSSSNKGRTIYKLKSNNEINLEYKAMVVPGMIGGYMTDYIGENAYDKKMLQVNFSDLTVGDVIATKGPAANGLYIYGYGKTLIRVGDDGAVKKASYITLEKLYGQDNFIVLRPSLAMKSSLKFTLYDQDSKKAIVGAKLKLQIKDGSNWKDIKEYTTDSNGSIKATKLHYGEYRFIETKYLDHYNTSSFKMYLDSGLKNAITTFQVSGIETTIYGTNRRVTYTVTYKQGSKGNFTEKKYTVPYGDKTPKYTPNDNGDWKFDKWDKELASTVIKNMEYTALWYKNVKVTTRYYDINTNKPIPGVEPVVDINRNGTPYKTTKKTIENYDYVKVDGKESGTRGENDIVVTYYYKTKTATLKEIHSDCSNNKVLDQKSKTVIYGSEYTTSPDEVLNKNPNYRLVSTPVNYKGIVNNSTVKNGVIEVKYCYAKKDSKVVPNIKITGTNEVKTSKDKLNYQITYTVEFKDYKDKAKIKIVEKLPYKIDTTKSNIAGGKYDSKNQTITWEEEKDIDSYKNSKYTLNKNIELTYIDNYSKDDVLSNEFIASVTANGKTQEIKDRYNTIVNVKGNIIVKYIDKETNKLLDEVKVEGKIGKKYTLEAKQFEDYELIDKPNITEVEYKEETQEFKYTYQKKQEITVDDIEIEDNSKQEDKKTTTNKSTPIIVIILGALFGGVIAFLTRKKQKNN